MAQKILPQSLALQQQSNQYNQAASQGAVAGPVDPNSAFFQADQTRRAALSSQTNNTQPSNNGFGGSILGDADARRIGYSDFSAYQNAQAEQARQQQPQQPQIDFDALIRPALDSLSAYEPTLQSGYQSTVGDINASKGTQLQANQANISGQSAQLESARTSQQNLTENAADEARRQYAEIQQGLQARYGGTSGTGAFAAELSGRQAQQNIGKLRQGLSEAMLQIDNKLQQVQEVGRIAALDIEDNARSQTNQAKQQLDAQLAQIRTQKGELQARKAELAANAIQLYQNQVNNINAQNAAFKQNLFLSQQAAEQQLRLAQQKGQGIIGGFQPSTPTVDPLGTPVSGTQQVNQNDPFAFSTTGQPDRKKLLEQYGLNPTIAQATGFGF